MLNWWYWGCARGEWLWGKPLALETLPAATNFADRSISLAPLPVGEEAVPGFGIASR